MALFLMANIYKHSTSVAFRPKPWQVGLKNGHGRDGSIYETNPENLSFPFHISIHLVGREQSWVWWTEGLAILRFRGSSYPLPNLRVICLCQVDPDSIFWSKCDHSGQEWIAVCCLLLQHSGDVPYVLIIQWWPATLAHQSNDLLPTGLFE